MNVLLLSWGSFTHGEATAGDVLAVRTVETALVSHGVHFETVWSTGYLADGLTLGEADPARFSHIVFICGPAHGWQVRWLHRRFVRCRRIAVGVSVTDWTDPAVAGFDAVLARDGAERPLADLADSAQIHDTAVVALIRAPGQPEYGDLRQHRQVHAAIDEHLAARGCAVIPLDTRVGLDANAQFRTADQFCAVLRKVDIVVTTRMHGLVLALRSSVPAVAVDPIKGGGKVTAQAAALAWPALVSAAAMCAPASAFGRWYDWGLSVAGQAAARPRPPTPGHPGALTTGLLHELAR